MAKKKHSTRNTAAEQQQPRPVPPAAKFQPAAPRMQLGKYPAAPLIVLAAILMAVLTLVFFGGVYKPITLVACLILIAVFLFRGPDWVEVFTPQSAALVIYLVICGLSCIWALSGKFFLQEFSKLIVAAAVYFAITAWLHRTQGAVYRIALIVAGCSALYTVLSVEAASTGLTAKLVGLLPGYNGLGIGFEAGTRLTGIFGNPNVLAGVLAIGTLLSLYLVEGAPETQRDKLPAALLSLNAFGLLLVFSMGGTAMFLLSIVVYLIAAGKGRTASLIHMVLAAVPTLVFAFVAFPCFNREGVLVVVPLLAMVGNVAVVCLLERFVFGRLAAILEPHKRAAVGFFAAICVLVVAYAAAALTITSSFTFGADGLRRSAYPAPGEHTLTVEATAPVQVTVVTQNMSQVMMHTESVLYKGEANGAQFTVPEDSKVVYFNFSAEPGTEISQASLDSGESIPLRYPLLPGFIANRLQGLWANQNAIQRTVFFEDGMALFAKSPVVGNGMGSFENAIKGIQSFYYETKYVHNNYIQVLLDTGVIGLLAYLAVFVCAIWSLWRHRKDRQEDAPFGTIYPALWAGVVMVLGHSAVEVTMSNSPSLLYALIILALISLCYGSPLPSVVQKGALPALRWGSCALSGIFVLLLGGNLVARSIASQPVSQTSTFLSNLELAASLDAFEHNDYKLSYVITASSDGTAQELQNANQYAAELAEVNSNSIPPVLVSYYLSSQQYEQAVSVAKTGLAYTASDSAAWNQILDLFRQTLTTNLQEGGNSPLADESQSSLLCSGMQEIYNALCTHNANSMENIALSTANTVFLGQMRQISDVQGDMTAVISVLSGTLFHSQFAADTDNNGVPDQISGLSGATWEGQTVKMEADGMFTITLPVTNQSLELSIQCQNPGDVTATLDGAPLVQEEGAEAGIARFALVTSPPAEGGDCKLRISSASAQTLEEITVQLAQ